MPKYLPMEVIRTMTYGELERWWEVDFDVLTSTALAEAVGDVDPSVRLALHSEDWLPQWADALYVAVGNLASQLELHQFTRDSRSKRTNTWYGQVVQRMGYVNRLLREQRQEEGWALYGEHIKHARTASLAILAKHFREEARELADLEKARRGLPPHDPWYDAHYADKFEAIDDAVRRGGLHAPISDEVQRLMLLDPEQFRRQAAADATEQEDRTIALRHPLLLKRWQEALKSLRDEHTALAGLEPLFTVTLPRLDTKALQALPYQDARLIINRRRFVRALAQRDRECTMHIRETVRAAARRREEACAPWYEAVGASREELARRYPQQLRALLKAFEPFCHPGTQEFRREALGRSGPVPREVIPMVKTSLADGTWQQLLN